MDQSRLNAQRNAGRLCKGPSRDGPGRAGANTGDALKLSIVIPVYDEEGTVERLVARSSGCVRAAILAAVAAGRNLSTRMRHWVN